MNVDVMFSVTFQHVNGQELTVFLTRDEAVRITGDLMEALRWKEKALLEPHDLTPSAHSYSRSGVYES